MLPGFVSRGPAVTEEAVAAFEERCGFKLPTDYREFLQVQNGGDRPVEQEDADDGEYTETIQFFSLGIAATVTVPHEQVRDDPERWMDEFNVLMRDIDLRMEGARDAGTRSYPPELLPIAELSLGVFLLRLKGRGKGAVLHCYDPDGYEPGHVNKAAKSFTELLDDLDDYQWG